MPEPQILQPIRSLKVKHNNPIILTSNTFYKMQEIQMNMVLQEVQPK